MPKVFVARGGHCAFSEELFRTAGWELAATHTETGLDLIQFNDGTEAIRPLFYREREEDGVGVTYNLLRDLREIALIDYAVSRGIGLAGVGRGAHLLHVISGGTLLQNVGGHERTSHLAGSLGGNAFVSEVKTKVDQLPSEICKVDLPSNHRQAMTAAYAKGSHAIRTVYTPRHSKLGPTQSSTMTLEIGFNSDFRALLFQPTLFGFDSDQSVYQGARKLYLSLISKLLVEK